MIDEFRNLVRMKNVFINDDVEPLHSEEINKAMLSMLPFAPKVMNR